MSMTCIIKDGKSRKTCSNADEKYMVSRFYCYAQTSNNKDVNILDICKKEHDEFRSLMIDLYVLGENDKFCSIVKEYENDLCDRLEQNLDGKYVLKEALCNT